MNISDADVSRFADIISRRFGIAPDPFRESDLAATLAERLFATHQSCVDDYLQFLEHTPEEWDTVANRISIPETYFFRVPEHFEAFSSIAVPDCIQRNRDTRRLHIASIGCASGEEPYSIAITLRDRHPELADWSIDIAGFDISPKSLGKALQAVYSRWSLRATEESDRERLFRRKGHVYELNEDTKNAVRFALHNVLDLCKDPSLKGYFDVVFFRNVLIYFSPETARAAIACISAILSPGAYLFVGPAETLRGLSSDFSLCHSHDVFYYRLKESRHNTAPVAQPAQARPKAGPRIPKRGEEPLPEPGGTWIDAIRKSSERIGQLAAKPALNRRPSQASQLHSALALMAQERFHEALDLLDRIPYGHARDPEVEILRAVLLTNDGRVQQAEAICTTLLKNDDLNASAHYLLALCREQDGDIDAAVEQDTIAAYLDPAFSMPHLHRAMMEKRRGQRDAACRELEQASVLLAREDPSRILLFGGGFSREALMQLCDREMQTCRESR